MAETREMSEISIVLILGGRVDPITKDLKLLTFPGFRALVVGKVKSPGNVNNVNCLAQKLTTLTLPGF